MGGLMGDEPPVQDFERFLPTLTGIRAMLIKNGRSAQADVVNHLIRLAHERSPVFASKMVESDFWGGSGSVVDVNFSLEDAPTLEAAVRENFEFHRLIIQLAD